MLGGGGLPVFPSSARHVEGGRYNARDHKRIMIVVGWPWLDVKGPPKPLYHSPPQLDRVEKI